jgi:hypothetical protein
MKYFLFLGALAVSVAVSGCMTGYTAVDRGNGYAAERDSTMPPPMTINDVIALSQDSVSADVIISQLKATDSYFHLTTEDIVALRKAGVNDKVINAMIQTANQPRRQRTRTTVYPNYYPYWWYSWYPYYWYPWNPWYPYYYGASIRLGHHGGYYGAHYYGGHSYGGGRAGTVRSTRTRR